MNAKAAAKSGNVSSRWRRPSTSSHPACSVSLARTSSSGSASSGTGELPDETGELVGSLEREQVRGVVDFDQLRIGDLARERLGMRARDERVSRATYHQRRRRDP